MLEWRDSKCISFSYSKVENGRMIWNITLTESQKGSLESSSLVFMQIS